MTPIIHLALTHDWELRGDGSGDIEEIQFAPLRRLLEIYVRAGAHTTILPDVMQQLAFRRLESKHPELKPLADSWDEHVRETFRQGHDIQLHVHPQWLKAEYANGRWRLNGDWSILNYDRAVALTMLADAKSYLENLLQPIDSSYRCLAFRAGALAAAPSDHLFKSLVELGIELDVSIAGGLFADSQTLQIDYRACEETFVPFFPTLDDARRVSTQTEPIVCVPLNHFYGSRREVTRQNISLARKQLRRLTSQRDSKFQSEGSAPSPIESQRSTIGKVYEKLVLPTLKPKHFVSDTGRLNYPLMREMLSSIRQRALSSGLSQLPVVLTNHPKDIRDLKAIERFVEDVARAEDLRFITLTEIVEKVRAGVFQVRIA
ncbi:MAG: hypothetical protein AABM67_12720 [Acidobacteriota bacterium]